MERVLACLFLVGTTSMIAGGLWGARKLNIPWQFEAAIIFVNLPALLVLLGIARGRLRLSKGLRALASAAIAVAAMTWANHKRHMAWPLAVGSGLAAFFLLVVVFRRREAQGELALRRANNALQSDNLNPDEAVVALAEAEAAFGGEAPMGQQALLEWLSASVHANLGNLTRSAVHANEALRLYQRLGQSQSVTVVRDFISKLSQNVATRQTGGPSSTKALQYSTPLALFGVLTVGALLALYGMWSPARVQLPTHMLLAIGIALGVWFLGLPWFLAKAERVTASTIGFMSFSLAILGTLISIAGVAIEHHWLASNNLPAFIQKPSQVFQEWLGHLPWWMPIAALVLFLSLALTAVLLLKGGSIEKTLEAAERELLSEKWDRAITMLLAVDVRRERNLVARAQVLFCLAFAYRMSGAHTEAKERLAALLDACPGHHEGLYLAGYLASDAGELDSAASFWRRLYEIDPTFGPSPSDPHRTVAYFLSVVLYRKALGLMATQPEAGAELLAEIGAIGAMDKILSKTLVRVHCHRGTELVRQRQWQAAEKEFELAKQKVSVLEPTDSEHRDTRKLQALCEAGLGIVALKKDNHGAAVKGFVKAREVIKDMIGDAHAFGGEEDLLAQLLRAAARKRSDENSIDPAFARDASFLAGIAQLATLRQQLEHSATCDWRSALAVAQRSFEESLEASPMFAEGAAMLGLLYCYCGASAAEKAKGLELLKKVQERVGSKFVVETVAQQDASQKDHAEARDSYFQAFQEYLRSSNVPRSERQKMRDEMLERMKVMGQDKAFMGRGGLQIDQDREQEPTIKEYLARAAMLRAKLMKLGTDEGNPLNAELRMLLEELGKKSEELESHARSVVETEKKIMQQAQALLFS